MAPVTKRRKNEAPVVIVIDDDDEDHLSDLPDGVLSLILSFLPAQDAVRTCALARAWRHVWKHHSPRRLLVTGPSVREARGFVDHLLALRLREITSGAGAPLDACDIVFPEFGHEHDDHGHVNRWIRSALECQVQALRVDMWPGGDDSQGMYFRMSSEPLVSLNLTRLQLSFIEFLEGSLLDFSACPALQDLEITQSILMYVSKMTAPSLKRLAMKFCSCKETGRRLRICAPSLVSLRLDGNDRTPMLESMPELVDAYVDPDDTECCSCADSFGCYHVMEDGSSSSDASDTDSDDEDAGEYNHMASVLLGGLSEATNLTLISDDTTYLFRRDLRWCPTFSKLKTLVINGYWCKPADCRGLARILEHAPILEKLTILFSFQDEPNYKVEMKGRLYATAEESSVISQHLQTVEVKCEAVNETVVNLLNFMGTHNIWFQFRVTESSKR